MPRKAPAAGEEPPAKKQRGAEKTVESGGAGSGSGDDDESTCALCLKSAAETEEKALCSKHGCATCAAGAWSVCEDCHGSLLSRDCPVCRSPYQCLELFPFPFSANPPPALEWSVFSVLLEDINVCVWEPEARRASFMLSPANPGASGTAGEHVAIAGTPLSLLGYFTLAAGNGLD